MARERRHGEEVQQEMAYVWHMCVDFTNLNHACLKDSFPFPRIDQLVDSTTSHELLTFIDAFSGYNQIRINEED